LKNKLPIWLSTWYFTDIKKKRKYKIQDVFVKGNNADDVMNNELLVNKFTAMANKRNKRVKLLLNKVTLDSQHGYGPRYEDEKLFTK
jgi:hypothetical protein